METLSLNNFACKIHPTKFASNTCSAQMLSPRDKYELDCRETQFAIIRYL